MNKKFQFQIIFLLCVGVLSVTAQVQRAPVSVQKAPEQTAVQTPKIDTSKSQNTEQQIIERLSREKLHGFAGGGLVYSEPRGAFQRQLDSIDISSGFGFSFWGGYHFGEAPFALGLNVDVLFYGSKESTGRRQTNIGGLPIFVYDTVRVSNTFIPIIANVRFELNEFWYIKPYAELLGGFTVFSSSNSYRNSAGTDNSTSSSAASWNYGGAVGTKIKFADIFEMPDSRIAWYADIKLKYLYGTETSMDLYRISNTDEVTLEKISSETDLMGVNLGVTLEF